MSKNLTSDKIALIYEFNKQSPLFARAAYQELEAKNYDQALEIIESGIELYPNYATGYIVYALALTRTGNTELALQALDKGCELIDSEETRKYYRKLIDEIADRKVSPTESRRVSFFDESLDEEKEEAEEKEEETEPEEDELEQLAKEINDAKMPEMDDSDEDVKVGGSNFSFNSNQFISETLAGIYYAQGNFEEAKYVYGKLIEMQPEKEEYFKQKIAEIDANKGKE